MRALVFNTTDFSRYLCGWLVLLGGNIHQFIQIGQSFLSSAMSSIAYLFARESFTPSGSHTVRRHEVVGLNIGKKVLKKLEVPKPAAAEFICSRDFMEDVKSNPENAGASANQVI